MLFSEIQAALLAAGYREERAPRKAGQRVFGTGKPAATARRTTCGDCGHRGLQAYSFYRPAPSAARTVIACPACGWVGEEPDP